MGNSKKLTIAVLAFFLAGFAFSAMAGTEYIAPVTPEEDVVLQLPEEHPGGFELLMAKH
jgi:hypothetical protein